MAASDIGTGTTISFQTGFFAEIRDISLSGMSRASHDAGNMSGNSDNLRQFIAGRLRDPGEMQVEINFDADEDLWEILDAAPEVITITFPIPAGGTSGATYTATGFCMNIDVADPLEDVMTATLTIKFTSAFVTVDAV